MNKSITSRREFLRSSAGAIGVLAFLRMPECVMALPETENATPIPFLDAQPDGRPMLKWDELESWITPNEKVFAVDHYGKPKVDLDTYKLEVSGLVKEPRFWTVEEIKRRRKRDVIATLECSGNSSSPGFAGAIGNIRWTGTSLRSLIRESSPIKRAHEVVFFGADEKVEKIRERDYLQNFARSLSLDDAFGDDVIVAWEMNGKPLTREHGAPLRLVVPGWFGIAWVKWLSRIELLDRRFMGKYMAREYVTIRGEDRQGRTIWRETSVGPIDVKSVTARAARLKNGDVRFSGAAWTDGTPIKTVQVKIDDGLWEEAEVDRKPKAKYAWKFWHFDWKNPSSGTHRVVSRAVDEEGRVQPSADDPEIKMKRTYWEANQQWPRRFAI